MKNNIYYQNLEILKQKHSNIYNLVLSEKTDFDFDISNISLIKTKSGNYTIEISFKNSKITLHSKFNPLSEVNRIIDLKLSGLEDTIIIIGFELGYLPESVINKYPDVNIFIFEPSLRVLKKALEARDLTWILSHKNIKIVVGRTKIDDSILGNHTIYRPSLLSLSSYKRAFPEFSKKITDSYDRYIQKNNINIATLKRFDRLWTKNSFKNAKYFFSKPGITLLKNFFNGEIGALVIGAGPSIEKDIDIIKRFKHHFILISVDTAFRPLIKYGVIPDFVVSVDPQYINSLSLNPSFYKDIDASKMPILIVDPAVYPSTIRNYPGKIVLTSSIFPPGKIIEYFSEYKGSIAAGGSVAVTAFDFARIVGANPIIITGLDLSYKNDQSHIKGSFVDLYRIVITNKFNTLQTQFIKYLIGGIPIKTTNNRGELCYTDKRMFLYKSWFEKNISESKSIIINATNRGLKLNNVETKKLEDIYTKYIASSKKQLMLNNLLPKIDQKKSLQTNTSIFLEYLEKIEKNLKKILVLSRKAKIILSTMGINGSYSENNKKLTVLEKEIMSFKDEINLISMTMQDTVVKIMKGVQKKNKNFVISESNMLYSSLEDSCKFLLKVIKNTKAKLKFLISFSDNNREDVDNP